MIKNIKVNKLEKREAFIHAIGINSTQSVNKSHLFGFATIKFKSNYLIFAGFWRMSRKFPAFLRSLKFGFLVKQLATFLISFSVWFFKNGVQPFVRFTEYRIYNYRKWFVLWRRTIGSENMQIPDFSDKTISRWQFLVGTKLGMTTCENTSNTV